MIIYIYLLGLVSYVSKETKSPNIKVKYSNGLLLNIKEKFSYRNIIDKNKNFKVTKKSNNENNDDSSFSTQKENKELNNNDNNKNIKLAVYDEEIVEKIILIRKIILIQTFWRKKIVKKLRINRVFNKLFKLMKLNYLVKKFIRYIKRIYYFKLVKLQSFGFAVIKGNFTFIKTYLSLKNRKVLCMACFKKIK